MVQKVKSFVNQLLEGSTQLKEAQESKGILVRYNRHLAAVLFNALRHHLRIGNDQRLRSFSRHVNSSNGKFWHGNARLPNGVGPFHAFVAGILVLYGIESEDGKIFALILHTSQYITVLLFGSISLILVNTMYKPSKIEGNKDQNKVERASK